jgi:hypothetical protein
VVSNTGQVRNLHTGILLALIPALALRLAAMPQVATIAPSNLLGVPSPALPTAERLALLHKALSGPGDPHDIILEIWGIGDPSSVPFLIEALARQGDVPREGQYGGIDTRFHVLDALQNITNHDAGRVWAKPLTPAPDWDRAGPAIVAAGGRLFVPDNKWIYVATPEGQITTHAMGDHVSRSLAGAGQRKCLRAVAGTRPGLQRREWQATVGDERI